MTAFALSTPQPPMVREPLGIRLAEGGWLPDGVIRLGIRRLLAERIALLEAGGPGAAALRESAFVAEMHAGPPVADQAAANAQHYEVPADFYAVCLGPHRKYSSCFWNESTRTLGEAEALALALSAEHAQLADGQRILELGCGWGSFALWMAEHFPKSRITAVSNSRSQKVHIDGEAARRGLGNIAVVTADLATFDPGERFDRVVSVECFEHLRGWPELFRRVASWLRDDGRFFLHVFTHRHSSYWFPSAGSGDWMGRHFFTGGLMPADTLAPRLQEHLRLDGWWRWDGTHYARTAAAWLNNLDTQRSAAIATLAGSSRAGGPTEPKLLVNRWRMFFMACNELWAYRQGREWLVSHYGFSRR